MLNAAVAGVDAASARVCCKTRESPDPRRRGGRPSSGAAMHDYRIGRKSMNPPNRLGIAARNEGRATGPLLRILLASFALLVLLTGCSRSPGKAMLESKLFSSVQVIGTRGVGVGQLNKPRSLALDALDNLYVVDMTGRVQKFSSNGV